ncbi:DEAD/DEAH box helicase [Clostridium sp. DJ247]|uniref:DEAD/DEAH box helicase n=1 Tax=Clostridium sp. DJ247 TaxID=2726188 RepID=UPI0016258920|nr:DEAD/DEAH box helicase [Clostridium sp. DJ247]MBC2580437.1 DEAD/DEAH box helicase [Clostridium sp. DJ247]
MNCTAGVYERGLQCYTNEQIDYMDVNVEDDLGVKKTMISAIVKSSSNFLKKYEVRVGFTDQRPLMSFYCNCKAYSDHYNFNSPCKHIAAVLIKYSKEKNQMQKSINVKRNNKLIQQLKGTLLASAPKVETKALNLEYKLQVEIGYDSSVYLELKVGEDKLYVVKNMREFIEAVEHQDTLQFGKNFTYNPLTHTFREEDKVIIDILRDIYETEKTAENLTRFGERSVRLFSGKKAYVTEGNMGKFFNALGHRSIDLVINNDSFLGVNIVKERLPLEFKLNTSGSQIILQQTSKLPIPLTKTGKYFYYNNSIYVPNPQQIRTYIPLFNTFSKNKNTKITFSEDESVELASYIIPALKKIGNKVEVHKTLKNKFHEEPLKSLIYFDKDNDAVIARVIFKYGDTEINALKDTKEREDEKIIIRDIEGEASIVNTLLSYNFEKGKDNFIIDEEEEILDFVANGIDKLQEIAEVYYSDSFKNIKIYTSNSYKSSIKLNNEDLLEFTFNIEGVDRQELKNVFDALKQKKKYYRLQNGGFIPVQSKELQHMSDMLDYLNIKTSDLENDKVILSKYNAAYMDSSLKDNNITFVERNKKFRELVNNIKDIGDIDYTIPNNLDNIMRGYQKFGFKWFKTLANCGFGGILADEMGLGKTLQTIAFITSEVSREGDKYPSLVICPTSLVYNWEDEIKKFQPELSCLVVSGSKDEREEQRKKIEEADIVITSYALIKRDIDEYKDIKFNYCFLDEAQNIKNPDSLNAQSVKSIKARGYFALTGTPIENSLTELWSIFDYIMPGYLLNHRKFVQKYEIPIVKNGDKKALEELNKHIKPFILRRLKKDVIKELPPKIEHNMIVDMTDEQKKVYAAYLQQAKEEVNDEIRDKGFNKSKIKILSILTRLRQICCDPSTFIENYTGDNGKLEALMDIVENNINQGHKILLFSQFTSVLKNIGQKFESQGIRYMYLDGSVKAEARGDMVKEFNQGEVPIFLISLKAGGTGLNLTSADIVIHFDPWWNPAVEEQASDRAHRIGQKKTVEVIRLIAKGTIEEKIYKIQERKREIINNVVNENQGEEILLSNMNENEIEELFTNC